MHSILFKSGHPRRALPGGDRGRRADRTLNSDGGEPSQSQEQEQSLVLPTEGRAGADGAGELAHGAQGAGLTVAVSEGGWRSMEAP